MDHPGHSFSPSEATRLIWSTRDLNLSRIVEAACINTFHCCNRAWPDVSLSDTLSSFITHITGIKGRSKRLTAIEPHTTPNTSAANTSQSTMVDTPLAILDVSSPQPQMNGPMVGSSVILQTLGSTQHTPPTGTNDTTSLDHSSLSYTTQESQNNILDMTLTGSIDEFLNSSSPSGDGSIINLAFLEAPNGHRTPASTDAAVQGSPRPTVPTTLTRAKVLPRGVRVLLDEAVGFLESTRGEITLTTASQPLPSSRSLPRGPHRIPSSQITTHCVDPSIRVTRNARSRLN